MTTKTTMPGPVAWVRRQDAVISTVRKQSGAWLPMVTTAQAEAYANARVREALEEAESIVRSNADASSSMAKEMLHSNADAILALIPPTK